MYISGSARVPVLQLLLVHEVDNALQYLLILYLFILTYLLAGPELVYLLQLPRCCAHW